LEGEEIVSEGGVEFFEGGEVEGCFIFSGVFNLLNKALGLGWVWDEGGGTDRTERSGEKFSLIIAATSSSEGF
jgi:hypothetical protein